jgi:predicted ATPase
VLALLGRLVEQSVVVSHDEGQPRFRMLEPLRQFALERLDDAGETAALRERHARWFAGIVDRPGPGPVNAEGIARYDRLERDHANVTAALTWLAASDPGEAARMCWSLWGMWLVRGHQVEGLHLAARALPFADSAAEVLTPRDSHT